MTDDDQARATQARIETLETRVAFMDHTVSQLDDVVTTLRAEVTRLEEVNRYLIERVRELGDPLAPANTGEERPPHY